MLTGGSGFLGEPVRERLLAAGASDVFVPRRAQYDLTDATAADRTMAAAVERFGRLDALLNIAGGFVWQTVDDPEPAWSRMFALNLSTAVNACRAALPYLKASHGRVVTVASTLGKRAVADATAYCASKFGVVGFSHALAAETGGEIGVTTMIPGGMKTRFFDDRTEQYKPQDDSRLNDPANTAQAILFALSQPTGCEVREMLICHEEEGSWP